MKLKEILEKNHVKGFQYIDDIILAVNTRFGMFTLEADTSNISFGQPVTNTTEYTVNGDEVTVNGITINSDIEVISLTEEIIEKSLTPIEKARLERSSRNPLSQV